MSKLKKESDFKNIKDLNIHKEAADSFHPEIPNRDVIKPNI